MNALIENERKKYHRSLIEYGVLSVDNKGIPSNADKSSRLSIEISRRIAGSLLAESHDKSLGQTSGAKFEQSNLAYIIHSGFISGYQNRYGDNLKPPTNVYHRMTA